MSGTRIPEPSGHRDGAFGLSVRDGRVLLVLNPRVTGGGLTSFWDLPGGTLEPGEGAAVALAREWSEETGQAATVGPLCLVVDGAKRVAPGVAPLYTWRAFVFRVEGAGTLEPGEGIEAVEWVPLAEVAERLVAPYHAAVVEHLAGDPRCYRTLDWIEALSNEAIDRECPRHLHVIAAAAAVGDAGLLARELRAALSDGVSAERVEETLLQIVPYAGFPRAIAAFGVARTLLGKPDAATLVEVETAVRRACGEHTFAEVYGETAPRVLRGLRTLHPALQDWTLEHAYGRVLARAGVLTLLERELLAVSILTAMGGLADPLLGHMRAAIRLGATGEHVAAAISLVPGSAGPGRRAAARHLLPRL